MKGKRRKNTKRNENHSSEKKKKNKKYSEHETKWTRTENMMRVWALIWLKLRLPTLKNQSAKFRRHEVLAVAGISSYYNNKATSTASTSIESPANITAVESVSQVTAVVRKPDPHCGTKRPHFMFLFAVVSKWKTNAPDARTWDNYNNHWIAV